MKCKICGKKMPPTVLEAHMKKSHPSLDKSVVTPTPPVPKVVTEKAGVPEIKTKDWDWGEINTCQQCREEWPSKLMEHHMVIRHGM